MNEEMKENTDAYRQDHKYTSTGNPCITAGNGMLGGWESQSIKMGFEFRLRSINEEVTFNIRELFVPNIFMLLSKIVCRFVFVGHVFLQLI